MKPDEFPIEVKAGGIRVKIYRVVEPNRKRVTVGYHEGGQRKLKQFSDERTAPREAEIIATRLNAGQGNALELTGEDSDGRESYRGDDVSPILWSAMRGKRWN